MWERFRRQFEFRYTPSEVEITEEDKRMLTQRIRALIAVDMQQLLGRRYGLEFEMKEMGDPALGYIKTSIKVTAIIDMDTQAAFAFTPGFDVLLQEPRHEVSVVKAAHRRVLRHFDHNLWNVRKVDKFEKFAGKAIEMREKTQGVLYAVPGKKPVEYHLQWLFEKK